MKHFTRGRQNILRMIRRRKFKEILQRVMFDKAGFTGFFRADRIYSYAFGQDARNDSS